MDQHGLLIDHPKALRFQLYYDDVEVVNPIGSKTGTHKLGLFYYSIQNLPHHYNSTMNSIFVLAVFYSTDLKKYGFEPIWKLFIEEMKQLESDTGVQLHVNGNILNVHGALVSFSADSLAAHEVLGSMSPSANFICMLCKATRNGIQVHFLEAEFERRTIEDHDAAAEVASQRRQGDPETGVRNNCPLNTLRCFHCTTNYNLDVMHDMLEGVCPYEVKLVLNQLIFIDHLISFKELNQRLKAFQYGFGDNKNKPSVVLRDRLLNLNDRKLGQKAAQMWCLIRMLPLIIGDRVPHGNATYEVLLLLLQCMDIIYAPTIHVSQTVYLKHLIHDHHVHFRLIFPDARMINKHHHMVHYPMCMRMSGPLINMQCLKYELKHGFGKRLASVNCNFKNICKSVAFKYQVLQCAQWSFGKDGLRMDYECRDGGVVPVSSLEGSATVAEALRCDDATEVFLASQVTLYGTIYKPKMYLALSSIDGEPQFGRITSVLVFGSTPESVKFVVRKCHTVDFITHFHADRTRIFCCCAGRSARLPTT